MSKKIKEKNKRNKRELAYVNLKKNPFVITNETFPIS